MQTIPQMRCRINRYLLFSLIILGQSSCVKEIDKYQGDDTTTGSVTDINEMQVPANFSYSSEKAIQVHLSLKNNTDGPMEGIKITILSALPENNGHALYTGATDQNGELNAKFSASTVLKNVLISTSYIGLPDYAVADISSGYVSINLGGSNPQRIQTISSNISTGNAITPLSRNGTLPSLLYSGSWNTQGVPDYLTANGDVINNDFLKRINHSLPERKSVPNINAQLLNTASTANIEINQNAQVWVTFVHEGSGNRNTLGYYKYHKNSPPLSVNDIQNITVVYPNLSYKNSGGGMISGNKVSIGTIGPDTMIGFVILSNAYDISNATVGYGTAQFYTNQVLNPESQGSKKNHHVMIWDDTEQKMTIGFEDANRNSGSDDDFNDIVIDVTSSPVSAIINNGVNRSAPPTDTDGDGIDDNSDEYPTDPELAFNNYYPSEKAFGYLAYEDLWPFKGDYDLNDLLVGYRFNLITNANNDVKEVQSKIFVKAAGGSYQHGFGIEFPVPGYFVETVNGPTYTENYIALNSNGTEANQTNAVVIVFDNSNSIAPCQNGYYVNTEPGSPVINSDTIRLAVRFVSGIPQNTLGAAPFNPFIISNKRRGYEIHMPDKPPTNLADATLFNTGQDRSNMALGRYYKSDNNLPWSINIPSDFPIITEKTSIINAYLHFVEWAQSGGTIYPDWYEDKPGYRDNNKLLHR